MTLRYCYNQHLQQASAEKTAQTPQETLLLETYRQMLARGKTRPDDRSLKSRSKDAKPFLEALIFLLYALETDKHTGFALLRRNTLERVQPSALPFRQNWQVGVIAGFKNEFDFNEISAGFQRHMGLHAEPLPAPLAVQTLGRAINAGKVIRPYAEASANELPLADKMLLLETLGQINQLIGFIGEATGLPQTQITALKNEILEDGTLHLRDLPDLCAKELQRYQRKTPVRLPARMK